MQFTDRTLARYVFEALGLSPVTMKTRKEKGKRIHFFKYKSIDLYTTSK